MEVANMTPNTCSFDGCGRKVKAKALQLCSTHYDQHRSGGPMKAIRGANPEHCTTQGCMSQPKAKGLCQMHYQRLIKRGCTGSAHSERPRFDNKESALLAHGWTVEGSGCWEWNGPVSEGRGVLMIDGQRHYAYRAAYETWVGPIPDGNVICHRCDNPICMNPDHLFAGTQLDNIDDMTVKGRSIHGIKHHRAVLSEADVARVVDLISSGIPQSRIAAKFGVARTTISAISTGRSWKREQAALNV